VDKNALYLLDTSVLLALIRGKHLGSYLNQTFGLSEVLNRPLVSIVSHGEIWALAQRGNWSDKKRAALREMLGDLVTIDLNDPSIIDAYVAVDAKCQSHPKGARHLSSNDMWIAATAKAAGAILLTTDNDFLHLNPDVCAVHYVDPGSQLPGPQASDQKELK
jgi:tRNA(fMet)-specific endonuclease VapC